METAGSVAQNQLKTGMTGRPMQRSNASMRNLERTKQQKPPLVIPHEIPVAVMSRHLGCRGTDLQDDPTYQVIAEHLWSYQYSRLGWDDFAQKIDKKLRATMAQIFSDCRSNGFFDPHCVMRRGNKAIVFGQLIDQDRTSPLPDNIRPTLCTLCEKRTCASVDSKGNPAQDKRYCRRVG